AARAGGGPVLYAERTQPGHGTDRHLRLGGLQPATPIRLVGGTAVLAPELVAALEARYDEAAAGGPPPQMRAMWVHLFDATLKSREGIDRALDAAAAANLNTVIVEVARRQDAYYTSSVLPRTPDPDMPADLDLLARLVPAARDRGLAVHAWVPALPAWHERYAGQRLPLWEAHGAGSAEPWVSVDASGRQGTFFDPGVPAVADHVVAVFRELAERYAIDAVHVDYLRYESAEWGYHPISLQRFRQATGATGTPPPNDPAWSDWRREQTRQLATRIRNAVRQVSPHVAVSMAGSTIGEPPASTSDYRNTRTWGDVFQAWPDWLREGLVDAVFPMNYFDASARATWFDGWVAFERHLRAQCGCRLAVGVGAWLNTPDGSLQQVRSALDAGDGAVVYSYQQNARRGYPPQALLGALRDGPYAAPAPPPALR
ncbi:MAG TPA: family 10 glycosylhydrolase, partial [Nitriliruptorales bacterium]|nr:family 10 glycosylhydrolase [Nitriliruptorales bacterium]